MKRWLILLVFYTIPILSVAQSNAEDEFGTWYMLFGKHQVSKKVSVNTGMQFRYYELVTNYNLNLFYTGINYHINSSTYLTVNYGYLDIDRSIEFTDAKNTIEHRVWEQLFYKHGLWNLQLTHRLRLEHRFLHEVNDNSIQNRMRYRLGAKLPLSKIFYATINNEFFINLEEETFRENRAYLGFGSRISKTIGIELGFLRQHINDLDLNRLQIGLYLSIDWINKN